jgi:hypothetical protein
LSVQFEGTQVRHIWESASLEECANRFVTALLAAFAAEEPATVRLYEAESGTVALEARCWPGGSG